MAPGRAPLALLAAIALVAAVFGLLTIGGEDPAGPRSTTAAAGEEPRDTERAEPAPRRAAELAFELHYLGFESDPDAGLELLWYDPVAIAQDPRWESLPARGTDPTARWFRELLRRHPVDSWRHLGLLPGDGAGVVRSARLPQGELRALILRPVGRIDRFPLRITAAPLHLERPYPPRTGTGLRVTGRVLDARSGQPVHPAEVAVLSTWTRPTELHRSTPILTASCETDGSYHLALHVEEVLRFVTARAPGHLPSVRMLEDRLVAADGTVAAFDFLLVPAGDAAVVRGNVVDERGHAVAAVIRVRSEADRSVSWRELPGAAWEARCDEGGRFELESLAPGDHVLTVTATGHRPWVKNLELLPRSATDLGAIVLTAMPADEEPQATFLGSLSDADGAPIAGAEVEVRNRRWQRFTAKTDTEGRWRIDAVSPGDNGVVLRTAGLAEVQFVLHFPPGEVVHYHYRHEAGRHFLGGTVVAMADDRPLPGIDVEATVAGAGGTDLVAVAKTDAQGRFRVEGLPAGDTVLMLEWQQPYADLYEERIAVDRDDYRFRFPFPEQVRVSGTARDGTGVAIAGVGIVPAREGPVARTVTGADGAFSLRLPMTSQQAQRLTASKDGYLPVTTHFLREDGGPGAEVRWDPVLFANGELAEIHGTVTDADGHPLADVECAMFAGTNVVARAFVRTDSEGTYRHRSVRPGPIQLEFRSQEHRHEEIRFHADPRGEHRVDAVLKPLVRSTLEIGLVDGTGAPIAGVKWSAWVFSPRQSADGITGGDGSITLAEWASAEGRIDLVPPAGFPEHHIDLPAAPASGPRRAVLRRGEHRITGVVRDPNNRPVPRAWVLLTEAPRDGVSVYTSATTDAQGRFSFENLAAGEYRCKLDARQAVEQVVRTGGPDVELRRGW